MNTASAFHLQQPAKNRRLFFSRHPEIGAVIINGKVFYCATAAQNYLAEFPRLDFGLGGEPKL